MTSNLGTLGRRALLQAGAASLGAAVAATIAFVKKYGASKQAQR
jgi:hypothetical protein